MNTASPNVHRYASWLMLCVALACFLTVGVWGQEPPQRRFWQELNDPPEGEWDSHFTRTTELRHALVQFTRPTSPKHREKIKKTGVRFLYYVPTNSYIVAGTGSALEL
ncbi:MAG: hypothetical protein ABIH23_17930, partial [bacterium]